MSERPTQEQVEKAKKDIRTVRRSWPSIHESPTDVLLAHTEHLEQIVAKLPVTKDGVHVVPRVDHVFSPSGRKYVVRIERNASDGLDCYVPESVCVDGDWRDLRVHECFSTRAAAEAALEAGDE